LSAGQRKEGLLADKVANRLGVRYENCEKYSEREKFATMHRYWIIALAFLAGGCDPILNIYGSFFPAWVVCLVVGVLFTVLLRLVFAVIQIEQYLGPLILIYPSLTLLLTLVTWLVFFQT
jgi:hypothetical protein